jgi:hypothetical protein
MDTLVCITWHSYGCTLGLACLFHSVSALGHAHLVPADERALNACSEPWRT